MNIRLIAVLLALGMLAAPLTAQEAAPHEEREAAIFWSSMSASGLLFITGIGMYTVADHYEDLLDANTSEPQETRDGYSRNAGIFWTSAVISMGASTAVLLYGLKRKYDADSPLAIVPRPGGSTVLAYQYRF